MKILNLELGLSEEERLVQELDEKVRWIDWVGQFSDKISNLRAIIEPKERRTFLDGIISKVTVKKTDTHLRKIELEFKYPYVDDNIKWHDPHDKSKGYELMNGLFDHLVDTRLIQSKGKKTEIEIVSESSKSLKKV